MLNNFDCSARIKDFKVNFAFDSLSFGASAFPIFRKSVFLCREVVEVNS